MNRLLLAAAATSALTLSSTHVFADQPVAIGVHHARPFGRQSFSRNHGVGHSMSLRDQGRSGSEAAWNGYDLQSSYDDRDWSPESGNDWWNDRPDRAFPRWVRHNQNCTPDRMWWSGSGWHC